MEPITSLTNPKIKAARRLRERRERRRRGVFCVEGARELGRALNSGYRLVEFYFCEEMQTPDSMALLSDISPEKVLRVSEDVYCKLVVRQGVDGVFGIFQEKLTEFSTADLPVRPLILALAGLEKPGNTGALLRTADALDVDSIVLLGESRDTADPFNPNTIRSSLGAVFTKPVCVDSIDGFFDRCQAAQISVVAAGLAQDGRPPQNIDMTGSTALLLGAESTGLSQRSMERASSVATIPMLGEIDSLNVSVAGAIMMYEAFRQRQAAAQN